MSKRRVWGVHGIWTKGSDSVDVCGHHLEAKYGVQYLDYNYPYNKLTEQRSLYKLMTNARRLAMSLQQGDHVIAHSNGASIVHQAMTMAEPGVGFGAVILVAPAFGADTLWPEDRFNSMLVIHNKHDKALLMGQFLYKHKFGALGRIGYKGKPDHRIRNRAWHERFGSDWPFNHSHMFKGEALDKLVRMCGECIIEGEGF